MVRELAQRCKTATQFLALATTEQKNKALNSIAAELVHHMPDILTANEADIQAATTNGLTSAMIERLTLTQERIIALSESVRDIVRLPDPIGAVVDTTKRPNGLLISQRRVPLGVIGIIYESRPNVTVDSAVLCLKSGNTCLLRGGKEAINTNMVLANIIRAALKSSGFPQDCVCLITDTSRDSASEMMTLTGLLDVLIPRGGAGLIKAVVNNARVPILETGSGNCHAYVDSQADLEMACSIVVNSKCSRPSVCNAIETLLVAREVAQDFLPLVLPKLKSFKVEIRGCEQTCKIIDCIPATELDYETEFSDFIIAVKVVDGLEQAVEHIRKYSTGHSETIITSNYFTAQHFVDRVDSACVYVNASTRFTDGGEFGLGAEIGISTQKMHARGPMGLTHLTSIKHVVMGEGQIR